VLTPVDTLEAIDKFQGLFRARTGLDDATSRAVEMRAVRGRLTCALASVRDAQVSVGLRLRATLRIERLPGGRVEVVGCDEVV
jgi:hypothetical protein